MANKHLHPSRGGRPSSSKGPGSGRRGGRASGGRASGGRTPGPGPGLAHAPILDLTIDFVGGFGDGVARWEGRPVFVPHTAPGDVVRARVIGERGEGIAANAIELVSGGADRVEAPCPHFGPCGGCMLQHISDDAYRGWKRDQVVLALQRHDISDVVVDPVIETPPASRRRATLSARRLRTSVVIGFNERGSSSRIVDMTTCLILHPSLLALVEPLRDLAGQFLTGVGDEASIALTSLDDGVEIVFGVPRAPTLEDRERLAAFAETNDLARAAWRTGDGDVEPLAHRRDGIVTAGGIAVRPPGHAFLQASREGQDALTRLVMTAAGEARSVVDLFCGIGTFTFPLAVGGATVRCMDSDGEAIAALDAASRRSDVVTRIKPTVRNLYRDPVSAIDLEAVDAAVIDPPRAGARDQVAALAASRVPRVIYVSCNPATFARDARTLIDGGYTLGRVTPVDQFVWSTHTELVAVFDR